MNKAAAVMWWEYTEKIKSRSFIISLFLVPAIILGLSFSGISSAPAPSAEIKVIGLVNAERALLRDISDYLSVYKTAYGQPRFLLISVPASADADSLISDGIFTGLIEIHASGEAVYSGRVLSGEDTAILEGAITAAKIYRSLPDSVSIGQSPGMSRLQIKEISFQPDFNPENFYSAFAAAVVLIMMIVYSGQMLVRNLFEEKSNRLIEILISSCTPGQLLAGKIAGLALLGFTQLAVWLGAAFLTGAADAADMLINNLGFIIIFFILGFIFYTSLFTAAGSLIKTEQSAQLITSYLSLVLIFPLFAVISFTGGSSGTLFSILSYLPFTSPVIILMRLGLGGVSGLELAVSASLLLVSIIITVAAAARLFNSRLINN